MGTDIHLYVERFDTKTSNWVAVKGPNPAIQDKLMYARWAREKNEEDKAQKYEQEAADIISGKAQANSTSDWEAEWNAPMVYEGWLYDGRNYDLFAILANVRNGYGFAGVETGAGFNYISDSRGLPETVSSEVEDCFNDDNYHSVTHIYLSELIAFDWNQTTTKYGVVDEKGYEQWKEQGYPSSYSGSVGGGSVMNISNEEMETLINGYTEREEGKSYYTRVSWESTYHERVGEFFPKAINKLMELSTHSERDDVRIIMGFDS